jgi:hypothetical protein
VALAVACGVEGYAASVPAFAKAVMYYSACRGAVLRITDATGLVLLGGLADVAYPALCDTVAKGMSPGDCQWLVAGRLGRPDKNASATPLWALSRHLSQRPPIFS